MFENYENENSMKIEKCKLKIITKIVPIIMYNIPIIKMYGRLT